MYAVVLSYKEHPRLRVLEHAHRFVLQRTARALATIAPGVELLGTSDLTRRDRKFSGNSLRCKRDHLLYHGTILYQFSLSLISQCLGTAPRQPDYRRQREHAAFIDNFPATQEQLRSAICQEWAITDEGADEGTDWPREDVKQLVAKRYAQDSWNLRM